ncbi:MAG: hypothetical protein GWM98_08850 [Nitrospinaceae bacterium]|nr:hypothetical protein [Nitrospinaceae bacterium]NIR54574.1 hypothetical protein [Nitrospinaceae bacterium]NIS84996.1 hypothetical protein [Nitrospinaceae bacterium]NIT81807.1 hypothetical protein [Nitrospinaceae bacterium]NIU44070.1 hypothetical protein [Nitrospinaceae bacterium]
MLNDISKWIKTTTDAGIALLGLAIIVQVLFGNSVPFVQGDVINSISNILATLGGQGLIGLVVIGVVYAIFNRPVGQK